MVKLGSTLARTACVWLLALGLVAAEDQLVPAIDDWLIQRWTMEDGLPEAPVMGLAATADGHLWCATRHHLVRFDGQNFAVVPENQLPPLPRKELFLNVAEGAAGGLWLMSSVGLQRWHAGTWQALNIPRMSVRNYVFSAAGSEWISANRGLVRVRGDQVDFTPLPEQRWVPMSAQGLQHRLIVPGDEGLSEFIDGQLRPLPETAGLVPSAIHVSDQRLWFASYGGLRVQQGGQWRPIAVPGTPTPRMNALWESRAGALWAVSEDGWLWQYQNETWRRLRLDTDGFPVPVHAMWEDAFGSLWLACEGGLACVQPRQVRMLGAERAIATWANPDGTWWQRSAQGITSRDASGATRLVASLPDEILVSALLTDRQGRLWVGSQGRFLYRIENGVRTRITQGQRAVREARSISALAEDSAGTLWVGSWNGLMRFDPAADSLVSAGESRGKIGFIRQDSDGSIWYSVQSQGLVQRAKDGAETYFDRAADLPGLEIYDWYRDHTGIIWIGGNHGLACWRPDGRRLVLKIVHGLVDEGVRQIAEDTTGDLWLGTRRGIQRLSRQELMAVVEGRQASCGSLTLDRRAGLAAEECVGNLTRSGVSTASDDLSFPTTAGLARINAASLRSSTNRALRATIAEVTAGERWRAIVTPLLPSPSPPSESVEIPPAASPVTIRFGAIAPGLREKVRFRYRMSDVDSTWIIASANQATVRWAALPAGSHRFEVEILGYPGSLAGLTIVVPELWWRTPWAFAGLVLWSSVLAAGGGRWWVGRRWRRRLRQQQAVTRERERIARDIHDDLGAGLTELSMLGELVRHEVDDQASDLTRERLSRICHAATELTRTVDEIVWAANPAHDNAQSFLLYMGEHAERLLSASGLRYRLNFPEDMHAVALDPVARHHLFLAVREVLANVIRHAAATLVQLRVTLGDHDLQVTITDDGIGFDPSLVSGPNHDGLVNVRQRMVAAGGTLVIASAPGSGTCITLRVPVNQPSSQGS